jgi:hypothetical protein
MHYNTLNAALAPVEYWQESDAVSLYHVFEQLPDGRHPRGKRYSLALVLSLLIVGKLAGMTTLAAKALVGAAPGGLAVPGVARHPSAVPLPGDLEQGGACGGRRPGHLVARPLADAAGGGPSLWH